MTNAETLPALARVQKAREQFLALTGAEPVAVSGLTQVDGGWALDIDVVEVRRIPDTASLMATYRVTTDEVGDVSGYERVRRFTRGRADPAA
jgi:hypothetical protein